MAKKRKRRASPDLTGRGGIRRYVGLEYRLLNSKAYRSLTTNARSLLVEITMLYNGSNNGSLYLSVQDAAHRMGVADHHAASRAFDELQSLGFIEMTQNAHFAVKASETSRARTWRLTWEWGPGRKHADWKFMNREPEPGTLERKRMERGLRVLKRYHKDRSLNKVPVVDSTTLKRKNGGFPPIICMVDSHHQIAVTMGNGATRLVMALVEANSGGNAARNGQVSRVKHAGHLRREIFDGWDNGAGWSARLTDHDTTSKLRDLTARRRILRDCAVDDALIERSWRRNATIAERMTSCFVSCPHDIRPPGMCEGHDPLMGWAVIRRRQWDDGSRNCAQVNLWPNGHLAARLRDVCRHVSNRMASYPGFTR